MKLSAELAKATDAEIAAAIAQADPLILRGLIYQLTGDEDLAQMQMERVEFGYSHMDRIANAEDVAKVQRKAVAFLKDLRDRGVTELDPGPSERLPRALELIAGTTIPARELEMWIEETGLERWRAG